MDPRTKKFEKMAYEAWLSGQQRNENGVIVIPFNEWNRDPDPDLDPGALTRFHITPMRRTDETPCTPSGMCWKNSLDSANTSDTITSRNEIRGQPFCYWVASKHSANQLRPWSVGELSREWDVYHKNCLDDPSDPIPDLVPGDYDVN